MKTLLVMELITLAIIGFCTLKQGIKTVTSNLESAQLAQLAQLALIK